MDATVAIVLYLTFYLLLSLLFLLWIGSVLCQCFRIYPYSPRSSRSVGPMIVMFTTNQEVPRGLEPSIIESSYPKFSYLGPETKVEAGVKMMGECVVCLGPFEENEALRLLPKCGHVFHAECVDIWLGSHATCPFCRAILLPAEDVPSGSTPASVEVVIDGGRGGG